MMAGSSRGHPTPTELRQQDDTPCIKMASLRLPDFKVPMIDPHDLARDLHSTETYFLMDCRPVLAYNSCHITGAVHVNIAGFQKKRFVDGKIGLADLVTSDEGKERFKMSFKGDTPMVVYDDSTVNTDALTHSHSLFLIINALDKMGRCPVLLQGGLTKFNVLHPSLCEINVPKMKQSLSSVSLGGPKPETPGQRDQPLDWKTAPPVHVLKFLVLGSEKDAKSKGVVDEFRIKYVLNVTPDCPNCFEDQGCKYLRINVLDTGTQKINTHFQTACEFIEKARKNNVHILIHCKAGISRSVTITIAYLVKHFGLSVQDAYQFVKDKRPAISPNLNFMGQLVAFEKQLTPADRLPSMRIEEFLPTVEQEAVTARIKRSGTISRTESSSSVDGGTGPASAGARPFLLKMPPGQRKSKKNNPSSKS